MHGRRRICACLFMLLAAGCGGNHRDVLMVTGQIESDAVTAGSRVGGRVAEVLVREGTAVRSGDLLIRLDDADAQAALAASRAQLAQATAQLEKARAGATTEQFAQAEAAVRAAQEQYNLAQSGARGQEKRAAQAGVDAARAQYNATREDYERAQRLLQEEAISRQAFEKAEAAYQSAEAQLRGAQEQASIVDTGAREQEVAIARANLERVQGALDEMRAGARPEDLASAQALRDAAEAQVQQAEVALRETQILAPIDGRVESLDVRPGDLVRPGPVVRLVNPEELEVTLYVGAAMLGYLQVGQQVTFTADAHGSDRFQGTIRHIASEGEFTPRNLQTDEVRLQQAFAVTLDLDPAGGRLRPGMTVTAHLPRTASAG